MLKEAGMKYLIYAPALLVDEKGKTTTNYPSALTKKKQGNRTLEKCLQSAQKNGIKVFVGLNFNERWWKVDYDARWLLEQMEMGNKVADELVVLYKEKYPDAMYGWYRYSSRFALPVFGEDGEITRYNVFNVIMIIRHARDGKKYLYDIINIKKETSTLFQSEDITQ